VSLGRNPDTPLLTVAEHSRRSATRQRVESWHGIVAFGSILLLVQAISETPSNVRQCFESYHPSEVLQLRNSRLRNFAMSGDPTTHRRWWQYKRTWFIGVPAVLVLAVVGLFAWGGSQPKPEGFAPTAATQASAPGDEASAARESSPSQDAPVVDTTAPTSVTTPAIDSVQTVRYTVDARSKQEWMLFDFTTGELVDGDLTTPGWDIALKRTQLLTNSGVTNPSGPGGALDLGEVPLEEATVPDTASFSVDVLAGEDEDEPDNPEIGGWYSYSFIKHIVSVKDNTYLVRTGEDRDALIQFDSYYCEDEEPACITFRYQLVPKVDTATP